MYLGFDVSGVVNGTFIILVCGQFTTEAIPDNFTPEFEVVLYISKVACFKKGNLAIGMKLKLAKSYE